MREKQEMNKTRQTFSKDFKAKVVLEALREESMIQQLSVKYRVLYDDYFAKEFEDFAIEYIFAG